MWLATEQTFQYLLLRESKQCTTCINLYKGGLSIHRHNDIRDLTASLMEEVSTLTETEPTLQPLSGETLLRGSAITQDDSRVDFRCKGFWNPHQDAFFDVRVFNPLVSSNQNSMLSTMLLRHEQEKRRAYNQQIREIEQGSFTSLIYSASGATYGLHYHYHYRI